MRATTPGLSQSLSMVWLQNGAGPGGQAGGGGGGTVGQRIKAEQRPKAKGGQDVLVRKTDGFRRARTRREAEQENEDPRDHAEGRPLHLSGGPVRQWVSILWEKWVWQWCGWVWGIEGGRQESQCGDCCSIQARKEDNLKGASVVRVERREAR